MVVKLQFETGSSFLQKIHKNFYYQYAIFRNAAYENVHLDLLQSFLKIKLKTHSQLFKKFLVNSVVLLFVLSITWTNYSEKPQKC